MSEKLEELIIALSEELTKQIKNDSVLSLGTSDTIKALAQLVTSFSELNSY